MGKNGHRPDHRNLSAAARRSRHPLPLRPLARHQHPQKTQHPPQTAALPALLPHCRRQRPLAGQQNPAVHPDVQRRCRHPRPQGRRRRPERTAGATAARHRRFMVEHLHPVRLRAQTRQRRCRRLPAPCRRPRQPRSDVHDCRTSVGSGGQAAGRRRASQALGFERQVLPLFRRQNPPFSQREGRGCSQFRGNRDPTQCGRRHVLRPAVPPRRRISGRGKASINI